MVAPSSPARVIRPFLLMLAMILMSAMREELEFLPVPKAFRGVPVAFLLTGGLALAFFGFGGMV